MSSDTPVSQIAADQPLAVSVAFSSSEEKVNNENECCLSDSTKGEAVKARRMHSSVKIWGPVALALLVVTLLAPFCYKNSRISGVKKGAESRRLAEGGDNPDEEDLSEFDYLKSLCAAVGAWTPSEGSSEEQRASPAMVDEVLATLEEGVVESTSLEMPQTSPDVPIYQLLSGFEQSVHAAPFTEPSPFIGHQQLDVMWPAVQGEAPVGGYLIQPESRVDVSALQQQQGEVGRKRHRPEGVGVEEPSSSWKMPRLDLSSGQTFAPLPEAPHVPVWVVPPQTAPTDLSQFPILFTEPLPEGVSDFDLEDLSSLFPQTPSSPQPGPSSQLQPPQPPPPPPAPPAAPAAPPTTALTSFETPQSEWEKKHPYVRIPTMLPGVVARPFDVRAITCKRGPRRHVQLLRHIREILTKHPMINQQQVNALVFLAEQLANHMHNMMLVADMEGKSPYGTTNLLGRRVLVFDSLYSISIALNVPWPQQAWWRSLAERAYPNLDVTSYCKNAHAFYVKLIQDMLKALDLFRNGLRPAEEDLIDIKRRLFCSASTTYYLRTSSWDEWREDDKRAEKKEK